MNIVTNLFATTLHLSFSVRVVSAKISLIAFAVVRAEDQVENE